MFQPGSVHEVFEGLHRQVEKDRTHQLLDCARQSTYRARVGQRRLYAFRQVALYHLLLRFTGSIRVSLDRLVADLARCRRRESATCAGGLVLHFLFFEFLFLEHFALVHG